MLHLLETNLPRQKSIYFALTKIYGIGQTTSKVICKKLGFSLNLKVKELSQNQITDISKTISLNNILINNELKKKKFLSVQTLIVTKTYRGLRKVKGLPVRGQRTHTNAKSAKKTNKKYK